ncbi:MAG: undecaprenyldiphospho-muramoylpentapeptide beta-N-acetylglucosaminyltransferase [Ignavibacteriae bacterium]|nr:MAG: undecaprenyldiphospho-muramoylpentapeptide beta-N-acetylglucosaminyltransferase [Ignavibacteriota bacterium]
MIKRIIFAAGGTGGHIFPAVAVADEIRKMNRNAEILFIGAKGRIEENIIPKCGYDLETLTITGFSRSVSPKNIKNLYRLVSSVRASRKILEHFKPEIVFGTGGFVSGPALWASSRMKIPTVIEEGNSYPGVTVRILSKRADKVIINFEETKQYLKRKDNVVVMPYPVRKNLKKQPKGEALREFGLDENKKTLFVFGGSQGAHPVNEALLNILPELAENGYQLIWQTGVRDYDDVLQKCRQYSNIKAFKFLDNMDTAYSASDLVICRSGISTVMELAYFGSAAILVPFPYASENHQEKNARTLVKKNAAEILLDSELNASLKEKIFTLFSSENRMQELKKNISEIADGDAAYKIAMLLEETAN